MLKSKKIFIYGVGRSGLVAKAFAIRLVQLGLKVFFIGETVTPIVEPDDFVIIISKTGQTMSAIQTANIVGRVGSTVAVITAKETSKLAHASNILIHLKANNNIKSNLAPLGTLFEDTAMVFLDALVPDIMAKLGETENNMRARHAIWV
ncbi:MAG: SIS domain-containing protein [Thermoplasmata archaeon]|nr:SIS domain-containing protein [Thermoplasmata archaeon]